MPEEAPPAKGIRLQWAGVPDRVKGAVEQHLQSKIASATVYPGGFSPGFAGKIVTAASTRCSRWGDTIGVSDFVNNPFCSPYEGPG